jgi:hypothetical protein
MDPRRSTFRKSRCSCYEIRTRKTTCKNRAWCPAHAKRERDGAKPQGNVASAARRNVELKHIRVSSIALRWFLAVILTASPLLAEYPPQSDVAVPVHRTAVRVVDENNNPLVGTSIFSTLLMDSPSASEGQTDTQKAGTERGSRNPAGNPDNKNAEPGGKTMSNLIIAALIAGGVVALILLLHGSDHKGTTAGTPPPTSHGVTPPPQEGGTVLVPGTPSVSSPH